MELKGEQISLVPLAAVALEGEFVEISSLVRRRNASRRPDVRQQSRLFARWNQSLRRSPNSNRLYCESADGGAVSNFLNHSVDLRAFAKPLLAARLPALEGSDASNKRRYKAGAE